jgi:hypothetical protein
MSTLTAARPRGLARAASEKKSDAQQFATETAERQQRQSAQVNHASSIKLERLARKDPLVRSLLDEFSAMKTTLEAVRQQNAELATKLTASEQALAGTTANLETAQVDLSAAREKLAQADRSAKKLGEDLEAARSDAAKARKELSEALKSPKK